MQTPATPPTKQTGNMHSGEMPELPTTPSTSHPAKFGASPRAPSFASVVSSSTMLRGSVKSPLSPTRDAHLQSPPQKQEQAHTQEQPAAAHRQPFQEQLSTTAIDQSGSPTICDILSTGPAIAGGAGETQSERAQPASPEQRADHGSPNKFREGTSRAEIGEDYNQDNELEDSESSDVEIYLTSLELHDSASRMHVLSGHGKHIFHCCFPFVQTPFMHYECMGESRRIYFTLNSLRYLCPLLSFHHRPRTRVFFGL